MNTVSVRISYRPIRVGWCVVEGSLEEFREAIKLTTTLWGGKFNPIISIGDDVKKAEQLLRTFRVDALFAVGSAPSVSQFVERINYLPWFGPHKSLFIQGHDGPQPVLLDIDHPVRYFAEAREREKQPAVDGAYIFPNVLTRLNGESDPLADALLATLGDYPAFGRCPIDYGEFVDRLLGTNRIALSPDRPLPPEYWVGLNPIHVTTEDLVVHKRRGTWDTPGVFIGDPASFTDLVNFWNLRAADIEVLFFPKEGDERLVSATRHWLSEVGAFWPETESPSLRNAARWYSAGTDLRASSDLLSGSYVGRPVSNVTWNGLNIIAPYVFFETHSVLGTIDGSNGNISVSFPLPKKPVSESAKASEQYAIVTTRPLIDPEPAVGLFHLPYIPQLNGFYGRKAHLSLLGVRVEPRGLGIVVNLRESHLHVEGISALELLRELFHLAGIAAKQSAAGKVAQRVIHHMGGLDSCRVFKIKGVRDLLHEFSVSKSLSHKQALVRIGRGFESHKKLFIEPRQHGELRPQDVFLHLVTKKIIRPGFELECSNCELKEWHSLNDLAETVDCPYCGAQIDSGPQLQDGKWQYRVSGLFARTRDHEGSIPVILTLLQALRCLGMRGMTWMTGLDLSWDDSGINIDGETDFVVLTRNYEDSPEVLLGECKTGMEIGAEQIDRLVAAAKRCSSVGIKAFVLFAKSGRPFSEKEIELIDARQTTEFNFILLTPSELEPYEPYENVRPEGGGPRTPHSLEGWANYSRSLYLKTAPSEILKRARSASQQVTE